MKKLECKPKKERSVQLSALALYLNFAVQAPSHTTRRHAGKAKMEILPPVVRHLSVRLTVHFSNFHAFFQPRKDTRRHHFCPFGTCHRAVKKLSQHLQYRHPHLTSKERRVLTSRAQVAPGKGALKPTAAGAQQPTLLQITGGLEQLSGAGESLRYDGKGVDLGDQEDSEGQGEEVGREETEGGDFEGGERLRVREKK